MAEFAKLCQNDYGLKRKPITTRSPQSNTIIERIHQTIGNIIRTSDVSNIVNNDPCSGILSATTFSVRTTYHTTLQAYLTYLVFERDIILNIKYVANWEQILQRKQERINCNNMHKNMHHNNHQYKVGEKILVKRKKNSNKYLECMGLFLITQINDNGTIHFQKRNHQWCHQYLQNKTIPWLKHINISRISFIIISLTLLIGESTVYRVALKKTRGSSLVVNHHTAEVRVIPDRKVNIVLVQVELSTSISGSHAATYVVTHIHISDTCLLTMVKAYVF